MPPRKKANQKTEATSAEDLLITETKPTTRTTRAAKAKANIKISEEYLIEAINNNENNEKPKKKRGRPAKKTETKQEGEINNKTVLDSVENIEVKITKRGVKNKIPVDDSDDKNVTKRRGKVQIEPQTDYDAIDFKTVRSLSNKEFNFKISTWNIQGLQSWLAKDKLEFLNRENPDILCIQDLQCMELQDDSPTYDGYKQYWSFDPYSGVGILTKMMPYEVIYGIGTELYEAGRCITAEYEKFYLVNVLAPNSGYKLGSLSERLEWNRLFEAHIIDLEKKKPVIISGDLQVAHGNVDVHNPKTSAKKAGFSQQERNDFNRLLEVGFIDSYRFCNPLEKNVYTYWEDKAKARNKNVGWRFDYILVSKQLENAVCDSLIRNQVFGSTHCPVTVYIHL